MSNGKQDAIFALRAIVDKLRDFDAACRQIEDRDLRERMRDAFPVGIALRSLSGLAAELDRELGRDSLYLGADVMRVAA